MTSYATLSGSNWPSYCGWGFTSEARELPLNSVVELRIDGDEKFVLLAESDNDQQEEGAHESLVLDVEAGKQQGQRF